MSDNQYEPESYNRGWREYQALVLAELKRLDKNVSSLEDKVQDVHVDLARLDTKVTMRVKTGSRNWGLASGGAVSIILGIIYYLITGDKLP
jgi:hypothetical protein